jgi:hypothetical protein
MRRLLVTFIATLGALLLAVGVAGAASQTVAGDKYGGKLGDIKKIVASNGKNAVSTKVFGLGKPCGGAQFLSVKVQNKSGKTLYAGEAGCFSGPDGPVWDAYMIDKGDAIVKCGKFSVNRIKSNGAYKVIMPRGCMSNAPNRIRVEVDGHNFASATGGHAGPTKLLARG